jgi:hypothetical protein
MTAVPAVTPQNRWLGVGHSSNPDASRAGAEAVDAAVAGRRAKLLVVFASERYDLTRLVGTIADGAPDAALIGCSTSGEIATRGSAQSGVVVTALGGEGFSVMTAAADGVGGPPRAAGERVAESAAAIDGCPHRALLLLTEGLIANQDELVRGAYGVVGAGVPLVGGCAGDDLKMLATYQFHGREVLNDSVVGAALGSVAPLGVGVRHGWRRVGEAMVVTESVGTVIETLDEQPALDSYLDRLDAPPAVRSSPNAFSRFALTHPLGLMRRSGEDLVRNITGADFERRTLRLIAEVPPGWLAWIMEGDGDSVLRATDDACTAALAALDGRPPLGLLAFDCIARREIVGEAGIVHELRRVADHAGGAPIAGFYTYGEIARVRGNGGFHNQTLVVLAVA